MNQWLFFGLLAPVMWSISMIMDQVICRNYLKNELAFTFLGGIARFILGLMLLLTITDPLVVEPKTILMTLAAGMLWIYPIIPYIKALSFEETSRIAIMLQSNSIFTLILAVLFINETLTLPQTIAFFLIFTGGVIASLKEGKTHFKISKALPLILLSSFIFGASDVLLKSQLELFPSFIMAFTYFQVGCGIASFSFLAIPSYKKEIIKSIKILSSNGWWLIVGSILTGIAGMASFIYAVNLGKVSLTNVLIGTQPLFIVILNVILFRWFKQIEKETFMPKTIAIKLFSFITIVIGLYLLN